MHKKLPNLSLSLKLKQPCLPWVDYFVLICMPCPESKNFLTICMYLVGTQYRQEADMTPFSFNPRCIVGWPAWAWFHPHESCFVRKERARICMFGRQEGLLRRASYQANVARGLYWIRHAVYLRRWWHSPSAAF